MQIDSHEMQRLVFAKKKKINKNFKMSSAAVMTGSLRVSFYSAARAQLFKANDIVS